MTVNIPLEDHSKIDDFLPDHVFCGAKVAFRQIRWRAWLDGKPSVFKISARLCRNSLSGGS